MTDRKEGTGRRFRSVYLGAIDEEIREFAATRGMTASAAVRLAWVISRKKLFKIRPVLVRPKGVKKA